MMLMMKRMENTQNRIDESMKHDMKRQKYTSPGKEPDLQRGSGGEN